MFLEQDCLQYAYSLLEFAFAGVRERSAHSLCRTDQRNLSFVPYSWPSRFWRTLVRH